MTTKTDNIYREDGPFGDVMFYDDKGNMDIFSRRAILEMKLKPNKERNGFDFNIDDLIFKNGKIHNEKASEKK
jgi:hypothetical protein